jgi:hypothetical protein
MKNLLILIALFIASDLSAQEIPCRQWHIKKDKYGNETRSSCKEAWQVNVNGQKHGKYIEYFEGGNPSVSATFMNGILNGPYKSFDGDGATILEEGLYKNGKKDGKWVENWYERKVVSRGQYLNGEPIGIWSCNASEKQLQYDFKSHERKLTWKNQIIQNVIDLNSKSYNGEVLISLGFRHLEGALITLTIESNLDNNKIWIRDIKDIRVGEKYSSIASSNPNFTIESKLFSFLLSILRDKYGLLKEDDKSNDAYITLSFNNGILNTEVSSRIFTSEGKLIDTTNLFVAFQGEQGNAIKKMNTYLDSVKIIFDSFVDNKKLIYSGYIEAPDLKKWYSQIIEEFKSRKPETFDARYIASIERELADETMLSFTPSKYTGRIKIDNVILVIMQNSGMEVTQRAIEYEYYIEYNITNGKFDGVQRIGSWDKNMVLKEGRVNAQYIYSFDNGVKKSLRDVVNNRTITY